ncbi:hypothetical protein BJV40_003627 [Clostridium beijerinckii]|nr:hypothetical protein [Clostridium beijerinckii]
MGEYLQMIGGDVMRNNSEDESEKIKEAESEANNS